MKELTVRPWSWICDSNTQPADYKSAALPIELIQHRPGKFSCLVCNYVTASPDNSNPSLTRSRPLKIFGDPSGTRTRKLHRERVVTLSSLSMGPYNPTIYSA